VWIVVRTHSAGSHYEPGRHEISAEDAEALAKWAAALEAERNAHEWPAPRGFESSEWPAFTIEGA